MHIQFFTNGTPSPSPQFYIVWFQIVLGAFAKKNTRDKLDIMQTVLKNYDPEDLFKVDTDFKLKLTSSFNKLANIVDIDKVMSR